MKICQNNHSEKKQKTGNVLYLEALGLVAIKIEFLNRKQRLIFSLLLMFAHVDGI